MVTWNLNNVDYYVFSDFPTMVNDFRRGKVACSGITCLCAMVLGDFFLALSLLTYHITTINVDEF